MGPETQLEGKLYIDGVPFEGLKEIHIAEAEIPDEWTRIIQKQVESLREIRISGTFVLPKHWRCKNRKRFIKLLMGEGVDSRRAENLARYVQIIQMAFGTGISYQEVWTNYLLNRCWIHGDLE